MRKATASPSFAEAQAAATARAEEEIDQDAAEALIVGLADAMTEIAVHRMNAGWFLDGNDVRRDPVATGDVIYLIAAGSLGLI